MNINSAVRASSHPEGMVLLNTVTGNLFSLNLTGRFVWELLSVSRSRDDIAAEFVGAFSVPLHVATAHVDGFLAQLVHHQLAVPSSAR